MTIARRGLLMMLLTASLLPAADPPGRFAIVELYTSEGCSSCPSADEVLAALAQRQAPGEAIYCLGFHIDYWDRLGWKDPYSAESATQRQIAYCHFFKGDEVYTPQMVVNGTVQFLGSDEKTARQAVAAALKTRRERTLQLTAAPLTPDREIETTWRTTPGPDTLDVGIALVQRRGENQVERGENAGRRLTHVGIVRAFRTAPLDTQSTGSIRLTLPADVDPAEVDIVGWIQDRESAVMAAATRIPLVAR